MRCSPRKFSTPFQHISAVAVVVTILCRNIAFSFHIKRCGTQKVPKRRLWLGLRLEELSTLTTRQTPSRLGRDAFGVSISFQWTHFVSVLCIWPCMTEIITSAKKVMPCRCVYLPMSRIIGQYTQRQNNLLSGGNDFCHAWPYAEQKKIGGGTTNMHTYWTPS